MQGLYPFTLLLVLAVAFLFLGALALGVAVRSRFPRPGPSGAGAGGAQDEGGLAEGPDGVGVSQALEAERSDGYEGWLEEPNWRGDEHEASPDPF